MEISKEKIDEYIKQLEELKARHTFVVERKPSLTDFIKGYVYKKLEESWGLYACGWKWYEDEIDEDIAEEVETILPDIMKAIRICFPETPDDIEKDDNFINNTKKIVKEVFEKQRELYI